jgi:hypothetical protein
VMAITMMIEIVMANIVLKVAQEISKSVA